MLLLAKRRLKIKLKIAFSFYQIATKVGETYMVVYPESVGATLDVLSFVNLELDGLGLPLACVNLGTFRSKLLFLMLAPLGVLLLTKVIGWLRHDRDEVRRELSRHRLLRLPPPLAAPSARVHARANTPVHARHTPEHTN